MSKPKTLRARIAYRLRCWADRIDHAGAPRVMSVSFTFEERVGIVFRDDGKGCPLAYLGDADYGRAHTESGPVLGERSTRWLPQRRTPPWPGADIPVASFTVRLDSPNAPAYRPPEPFPVSPMTEHLARFCTGSACRSPLHQAPGRPYSAGG